MNGQWICGHCQFIKSRYFFYRKGAQMKANKIVLAAIAMTAFSVSGTALALQAIPGNGDPLPHLMRMAIQNATVPMQTAILKAEEQTGGKAIDARLFAATGGPVYLISLKDPVGPGVIDVKVDARSGQVFGGPEKMHIEDASHRDGT